MFAVVNQGEAIILSCKQQGSDQCMYWYRQYPRQGPELLFMSRLEGMEPEDESKDNRFSVRRPDRQTFPLNLSDLKLSDSAVYFCASSADTVL
ncbi:TVB8 protein, partial [Amia calva]|nr:TVB8 protein [Amia calva]